MDNRIKNKGLNLSNLKSLFPNFNFHPELLLSFVQDPSL